MPDLISLFLQPKSFAHLLEFLLAVGFATLGVCIYRKRAAEYNVYTSKRQQTIEQSQKDGTWVSGTLEFGIFVRRPKGSSGSNQYYLATYRYTDPQGKEQSHIVRTPCRPAEVIALSYDRRAPENVYEFRQGAEILPPDWSTTIWVGVFIIAFLMLDRLVCFLF